MFKILSAEDNIIIECNDTNDFKIHFSTKLNNNVNIQSIVINGQLYQLLSELNKDIVESYHLTKNHDMDDITYVLNIGSGLKGFLSARDSIRYKLHMLNKTHIQSPNKFQITGNSMPPSQTNIKECNIANVILDIEVVNSYIAIYLSYKDVSTEFNNLQKHTLSRVISKMLFKLKQYLE